MDFCFASYIQKISPCFLIAYSQEDIINKLLRFYIVEGNIKGKTGDLLDIDKSTASKLINQKINLPREIRKALKNIKTNDELLISYFKEKIIPDLNPNKIESLSSDIERLVNPSDEISLENKVFLSNCIKEKKYADFFAISFKYTLCINNTKENSVKSDEELEKEHIQKNTTSQKLTIPKEIQTEEQPYITAIVEAISEKEKNNLSIENVKDSKKYNERLNRHRTEYFSAEYVRHQAREIYDENENVFDDLQEELKDGIIYTVEKTDYNDGYDRLTASLEQAARVQLESSQLIKDTNLVNMKAKQGLCHTLINDEKLPGWTNDKYN